MRSSTTRRAGVYHYEKVPAKPTIAPPVTDAFRDIPFYGYLEGFRIMVERDCPNMDCRVPYRLCVQLIDPDGKEVPLTVTMIAESVQ